MLIIAAMLVAVIVAGIVGQYGMQGLIIATIMAGVFLTGTFMTAQPFHRLVRQEKIGVCSVVIVPGAVDMIPLVIHLQQIPDVIFAKLIGVLYTYGIQ